MAEPQIKYVRTSDGVNIAYFVMGEGGPPLVIMDVMYSHLQAEWANPRLRRQYEAIARVSTLVRYDHRGFGVSDRDPEDLSLDGFVLDLEAVVERVLPDRPFVLISQRGVTTPIAVTYAARHPEQVFRLVLTTPMGRVSRSFAERMQAIVDAPGANERSVTESMAREVQGWDDHEASQADAAMMRQSISLDGYRRFLAELLRWDVLDLLPLVKTPTLLTSYKDNPWFGGEQVRELAALLPDSQLATIDAATSAARGAQTAAAIAEFLGAVAPPEYQVVASTVPATAIILFTDIVDSTALTEQLGDVAFRERSSKLDAAMRRVITSAGGTAIEGKLLGDGVMAVFGAAREAIAAAVQCNTAAVDAGLELHLGIHAGDVIRDGGNVYGGAVNIAARIASASAPGEVLVSATVRELARTSAAVEFEDRGEREMKGVGEPVRVYAVRG
jgi:class 3 adenylate cyclase